MRKIKPFIQSNAPIIKFLLVVIVVAVIFYYRFGEGEIPLVDPQTTKVPSSVDVKADTPPAVISSTSANCVEGSSIDYIYYPDQDPLWKKNNKFGMYIYPEVEVFMELSQNLVNSNGGDWGYVLIPFNVKETNSERWDKIFKRLYEKHLIPIISLHDIDVEDYREQTRKAAVFLNNFVWPIRYRYVTVYNEPNDANFWYGRVDPKEYATILNYTIDTFKEVNSDYFMLNGALNVSAATTSTSLDAFDYMKRMQAAQPGIFDKLDGWASHSYPQPNFSGHPSHTGRWSIKAYESELEFLKELGVKKKLPVFITETGWAHSEGKSYNGSYFTSKQVGDYFTEAFEKVWNKDEKVRAVIPFTIWYGAPFDHFSWVNKDRVPYEQYEIVKKLKKTAGAPPVYSIKSMPSNLCN